LWNNLQNDVVSAPSLNSFKGRLDKYWGDCCYSLDPSEFVWRSKWTANRSYWPKTKAEEEGKGKGTKFRKIVDTVQRSQ